MTLNRAGSGSETYENIDILIHQLPHFIVLEISGLFLSLGCIAVSRLCSDLICITTAHASANIWYTYNYLCVVYDLEIKIQMR